MDSNIEISLTEDEAELYDRQIRLWGLEAQQRLRKAKVLIIGVTPSAAEIAKNIVLSGINSLTLIDDKNVTEVDVNHNFLLPRDCVGKNRALSAVSWCQELNPMVDLKAKDQLWTLLSVDDLKLYDLTCLATEYLSFQDVVEFNKKCREAGVKLIVVGAFGSYGFSFTDLMSHDFAEEEIDVPFDPPAKKPKTDDDAAKESRMVKKNAQFCPISDALDFDWSSSTQRTLRRLSPVYFLVQAMLRANREGETVTLEELKESWKKYAETQKIDTKLVSEERLSRCEGIVAPVFPIVGGVVGQEVIKTVSHKDPPLKNFFFFDAEDCSGSVNAIGLSSSK